MAIELTTASPGVISGIRTALSAAETLNFANRKTIYVSRASNSTDNRSGLNNYDFTLPFASLSAAVNAAVEGDAVVMLPGTYLMDSEVALKKNMSVTGTGNVVLSGRTNATNSLMGITTAGNILIENLTLDNRNGFNVGACMYLTGEKMGTVNVRNCRFQGRADNIFALFWEGTLNLHDCEFVSKWDSLVTTDSIPDLGGMVNVYNSSFLSTGEEGQSRCMYVPGLNVNVYNTTFTCLSGTVNPSAPIYAVKVSNADGGTPVLRLNSCRLKTLSARSPTSPLFVENGGQVILNGCSLINMVSGAYSIQADTVVDVINMNSISNSPADNNVNLLGTSLKVLSSLF